MRRCPHNVYWPEGDAKAFGCSFCNPDNEHNDAQPVFNRRGALKLTGTGKLPKCPTCGVPVTISEGGKCLECGTSFDLLAMDNLRANNKQAGICPDCGCGIHFDNGNEWKCADCGAVYAASKRKQ